MLKNIEHIINYEWSSLKNDIDEYILFLLNKDIKKTINKDNFFYNEKNYTIWDYMVWIFDLYKLSKYKWWIYFLTNNIENIYYLYSQIYKYSKILKLPTLIVNLLQENIKSYKLNKKINVFKDSEYIKLLFIKDEIYKINDFSILNIEYIIKEDKSILNIFDLDINKLLNNKTDVIELLLTRNVTTVYNRTEYNLLESLTRIKKSFQKELMNFLYINNISFKNEKDISFIVKNIETFLIFFWKKELKKYINDFIYYLYNNKNLHKVEIVWEINKLLTELEISILEDFYIIAESNWELYSFIQHYLIIILKKGVIWNFDENTYIDLNKLKWEIKDFFNYRIYY